MTAASSATRWAGIVGRSAQTEARVPEQGIQAVRSETCRLQCSAGECRGSGGERYVTCISGGRSLAEVRRPVAGGRASGRQPWLVRLSRPTWGRGCCHEDLIATVKHARYALGPHTACGTRRVRAGRTCPRPHLPLGHPTHQPPCRPEASAAGSRIGVRAPNRMSAQRRHRRRVRCCAGRVFCWWPERTGCA